MNNFMDRFDDPIMVFVAIVLGALIFGGIGYSIGAGRGRGSLGCIFGILLGPIGWAMIFAFPPDHDAIPNYNAADAPKDEPTSFGRVIGGLIFVLAAIALVWAVFFFDTSVPVPGLGRVNNLGLMNERTTWVIAGVGGAIVGVLLIIFCGRNATSARKCSECLGKVPMGARKCMHCGSEL